MLAKRALSKVLPHGKKSNAFQCVFAHLMRRVDSLEKTLMLGGVGGRRRRERRRMRWLDGTPTRCTWVWVNSGSWWWTERPGVLWFMGLQRVGHDWVTEVNWTEVNKTISTTHKHQLQIQEHHCYTPTCFGYRSKQKKYIIHLNIFQSINSLKAFFKEWHHLKTNGKWLRIRDGAQS